MATINYSKFNDSIDFNITVAISWPHTQISHLFVIANSNIWSSLFTTRVRGRLFVTICILFELLIYYSTSAEGLWDT